MIARKGATMRLIVQFLNIPLPLRIVLLFLFGACLGAAVNLGIYRLAYLRRRISPWSYTLGPLKPRSGLDRIPILGWFGLATRSCDTRARILDSADAVGTLLCAVRARIVLVGSPAARFFAFSHRARFSHARFGRHGRIAFSVS